MVSGLLGGALLGLLADLVLGTAPWGLVAGALVGTGAGIWRLLRMTAGLDRRGAAGTCGGSESNAPNRDF